MGFYADNLFPRFLDAQMNREKFRLERAKTLSEISGNVLEVGFGTGLNLPHYPYNIRQITALDILSCESSKKQARIRESSIAVNFHQASSESMPFGDESFDCVLSTWTLCSVANLDASLAEIRRVLKKNGRFVFLEHGLAEGRIMQKIQRTLTPLQKIVACGCHLDRAIDAQVKKAGFRLQNLEKFRMNGILTSLAGSMYRGVALPT